MHVRVCERLRLYCVSERKRKNFNNQQQLFHKSNKSSPGSILDSKHHKHQHLLQNHQFHRIIRVKLFISKVNSGTLFSLCLPYMSSFAKELGLKLDNHHYKKVLEKKRKMQSNLREIFRLLHLAHAHDVPKMPSLEFRSPTGT